MKTLILRTLVTLCVSGLLMSAAAQTAPGGTPDDNNAAVAPTPPPPEAIVPPPDEGAMNEAAGGQPVRRANDGRSTRHTEKTGDGGGHSHRGAGFHPRADHRHEL